MHVRILTAALLGLALSAAHAAPTAWNGGTGDWTIAGNWTNGVPNAGDDVTITATPGTTATLTNLPASLSLQSLTINGTGLVEFFASGLADLTIAGDATPAVDFSVTTGTTLWIGGTSRIRIFLPATATGEIEGDVVFAADAANVAHAIISQGVGGLTVKAGGSTAMAPVGAGGGSGFGAAADGPANGGVVYEAGATHYQAGTKNLVSRGGSGVNPFVLAQPNQIPDFQPGSNYVVNWGFPNFDNRRIADMFAYGHIDYTLTAVNPTNTIDNFTLLPNPFLAGQGQYGGAIANATAGNLMRISENLSIHPDGPIFAFKGAPASAQNIQVRGNIDTGAATKLDLNSSVNRFLVLDGTTAQDINLAGAVIPNLTVDNSAGIVLSGVLGVSDAVNVLNGTITTTGNGRLALAPSVPTPPAYTGPTPGIANIVRNADVGTVGNLVNVDLGGALDVTVEVSTVGTGSPGRFSAVTVPQAVSPIVPAGAPVDRHWIIADYNLIGYSGSLTLRYDDADITSGSETALIPVRFDGTEFVTVPGTSTFINTTANTVTIAPLTRDQIVGIWSLTAAETPASARLWDLYE